MKVKIKTYKELKKIPGIFKTMNGLRYKDGSFFHIDMKQICGMTIEVNKVRNVPMYYYEFGDWFITDWMIEDDMNRNGANEDKN